MAEIDHAIQNAEKRLRLEGADFVPFQSSLLKEKPQFDPRVARAIAEYFDRRFELHHAARAVADREESVKQEQQEKEG